MKVGRNDSCSCGSGKKFKKCCGLPKAESPDELTRRRWSLVQSGLIDKIMRHVAKFYGQTAIDEAFDQFYFYNNEGGFDPGSQELPIFMPWFFYEWIPDLDSADLEDAPQMPPALSLAESGRNISADEKRYLYECVEASFSFFEILGIVPDTSLQLKDVLTGEAHTVLEKKATHGVQIGDLFFGKVVSIDDIGILETCAPVVFRPQFKLQIIQLREAIQKKHKVINQLVLHEWHVEVLDLYRTLYEDTMDPEMPTLVNTDGHAMVPHKMVYEIDNAHSTFEALHGLCVCETKEQLLADAKFDSTGCLETVEFPWLKKGNKQVKSMGNTVLGHIKIDGAKMTVEVNSKERAKKFAGELKKRLPSGWKLRSTVIDSIEKQIEDLRANRNKFETYDQDQDKMLQNPEVRQHMEKLMKAEMESWIHKSIPALDGLKPTEAAKTKKGREKLNALLTQFERDATSRPTPGQTVASIRELRAKLGMS